MISSGGKVSRLYLRGRGIMKLDLFMLNELIAESSRLRALSEFHEPTRISLKVWRTIDRLGELQGCKVSLSLMTAK